jgi:ubiquinone/menaquinone biosynthesis C-methylase UbiE
MSAYDAAAPSFERHRALPDGVAETVRTALLDALAAPSAPCLLDLGAGTGRIGRAFVAAGDDYVGLDLSFGMLREFARSVPPLARTPRLVRANGESLPFRDAAFDAVMLIQIFGGMGGWRRLLGEARRVLRPTGALVVGRSVTPVDGLDAQMKQYLESLLAQMAVQPGAMNARADAQNWLQSVADTQAHMVAATWTAERTPRRFIDRHRTGARFSALPPAIKEAALAKLGDWAATRFGSLDTVRSERHEFELRIFRFR